MIDNSHTSKQRTTGPSDTTPAMLDDPATINRFLRNYQPQTVARPVWQQVAPEVITLVEAAGASTRLRVEKDIQAVAAVVAHLVERGRPITLDEVLCDATLLTYEATLTVSMKTRENKRGILRRLQAVHRGLPWRVQRRADGDRVAELPDRSLLVSLASVTQTAHDRTRSDVGAAAFLTAYETTRERRCVGTEVEELDGATWIRARDFAACHGWALTKRLLDAAVTHEILAQSDPVAVLRGTYRLSRRDLDLALTAVADLPTVPNNAGHRLLRGPA